MLTGGTAGAAPLQPWLDGLMDRVQRDLRSAACLGGLEVPACRVRLVAIVDASADFGRLSEALLRGLDAPTDPPERARFRTAVRAMLLSLWTRRLAGEPRLEFRLADTGEGCARGTVARAGEATDVELTVMETRDGPRIVDIAIDGAGLVDTWRPRFAHTLRKDGWQALLDRLAER